MTFVPDQVIYIGQNAGKPRYIIDEETGCWNWCNRKTLHTKYNGVTAYPYHRKFYEYRYGKVPKGFDIHHKCENKLCVNPDHMEVKSHNIHRAHHGTVGRKCSKGCSCGRHFPSKERGQKISIAVKESWNHRR
jgi:hypothetical protein